MSVAHPRLSLMMTNSTKVTASLTLGDWYALFSLASSERLCRKIERVIDTAVENGLVAESDLAAAIAGYDPKAEGPTRYPEDFPGEYLLGNDSTCSPIRGPLKQHEPDHAP